MGIATEVQSPPSLKNGAEVIAQALHDQGAEYFFNNPGNGVYPLLDPIFNQDIKYVLGLQEGSIVSIADGYARASGKVPFVNVYMMPGLTNSMSAIYIAHRDRVPMVITSTEQSRATIGRDTYASTNDLVGTVRPLVKWAWQVNAPERLPEAIHRAHLIAATPPYGPVFLSLPFDLFSAKVEKPLTEPSRPSAVPVAGPPPPSLIERAARMIADAERVLFILGKDVINCGAVDAVVALADAVGVAAMNEPWTQVHAFPRPHPLFLGDFTREAFDEYAPTLVIGFGARLFVEATGQPEPPFPAGTRLISIGLDPGDLGRMQPSDLSGIGDVRLAAEALRAALASTFDGGKRAARLDAIERLQTKHAAMNAATLKEHHDHSPMSLARLAIELNKVITPETVLVEHSTTSAPMLLKYLELPKPTNVFSNGGSVMGWGTPASLGIQLARSTQKVLAIVGDGGFTYTCQALWTAGRYKLPATIVVLNNHGYRSMRAGVLRSAQGAVAKGYDFDFDFEIDIASLAKGFGVPAWKVSDPADVAEVVKEAMMDDRPGIIEVEISPNAWPWI